MDARAYDGTKAQTAGRRVLGHARLVAAALLGFAALGLAYFHFA